MIKQETKKAIVAAVKSDDFKKALKATGFRESLTDLDTIFYGTMSLLILTVLGTFIYLNVIWSPTAKFIDAMLITWLAGAYLGRLVQIVITTKPTKSKSK